MAAVNIFLQLTLFLGLTTICVSVTTVFIDECKPGKYFWKEKLPTEFYACLTLPKRAVKLRCPPGSYMCNTGPDFFQPCMCKGKWTKYFKQYGVPEKGLKFDKLQQITFSGDTKQIIPKEIQRMMSTESVLIDVPRGPEGKQGPENLGSGIVETELPEPSLPHSGCPDDFRLVNDAHMYYGIKFQGSLIECQYNCLSRPQCLGVDWNRKKRECYLLSLEETGTVKYGLHYNSHTNHYRRTNCLSTVASTNINANTVTANPRANIQPTTTRSTVQRIETTSDPSLFSEGSRENTKQQTAPEEDYEDYEEDSEYENDVIDENNDNSDGGTSSGVDFNTLFGKFPNIMELDGRNSKMASTEGVPSGPHVVPTTPFPNDDDEDASNFRNLNTGGFQASTTTIPDSGCPFTFEKFEDTSHPYGNNITTGNKFTDEEECKHWCLIHSFCKGVDFNSNTATCYYHREIDVNIITSITGVTHYRKTDCEPPLKCWSQDGTVRSEDDLSVTSPDHAQVTCNGVCFVSQTHTSTSTTITRGCLTVTDPAMKPRNGCGVDTSMQTIVCFCDTRRCNGLSISALTSQMLYLPLDSDLQDHSGHNRSGVQAPSSNLPDFQCLDKAVNCAALFTGTECISVNSLSTFAWGTQDDSDFIPSATFAVWFKRVTNGGPVTNIQGIFGNSIDTNDPSWQIIAEMLNNYVGAGVNTQRSPQLDDFMFIKAKNEEWHLAVLTYDGRYNITAQQFPSLKLFIDCIPVMGNSVRDSGEIEIRNQPVSVGCVQGQNFVGFIDEARIFSTVLSMNDIRALKAMRDTNYFW